MFENMSIRKWSYVVSPNQQPYAIRTSVISLSASLHLVAKGCNQTADGQYIVVRILVIQAFCTHVTAMERKKKICRKPKKIFNNWLDTKKQEMIFNYGCKSSFYLNILASAVKPAMVIPMCLSMGMIFFWCAESSDDARLRAIKTACVLFLSPTVAEPSFTASIAYSTWCRRPWGLHTVTSLSYWFRNYKTNGENLVKLKTVHLTSK